MQRLPVKITRAAGVMRGGGVIAYPTEAVWGLGCDPFNPDAVSYLLSLKQRDVAKGVILVAADMVQLAPFLDGVNREQLQKLQLSWPGAITWLVPDNGAAPWWIRGDHSAVALRVSAHPLVAQLCRAFGGPIVSTSANLAGQPAARHLWQVKKHFGGLLDDYVPGALGGATRPSIIRDLLTDTVLRG